jgi:hypothetical protein
MTDAALLKRIPNMTRDDLLETVFAAPWFLSDGYYREIAHALQARYNALPPVRPSFECHVTVDPPPEDVSDCHRIAAKLGWKTSEIERDPVLGDRKYFYFTAHARSFEVLKARMDELTAELRAEELNVLREKIENIVYDTKGS